MSIFDTSTLGVTDNQIVFNNYGSFPIYRVISRAPQQRQLRELDIPIPFESGIADFQTLIGKSLYVIEGKMYPSSESDYSTGLAALRKLANLDYEQNDTASDGGYVPYVWSENGTNTRQLFLKVLYVNIKEDTRQGLIQPFQLICKVKDPTIYGYPAKLASTQGISATGGSGSAKFPLSFPVVFGGTSGSVTNTAINNGTIPVYPQTITVYGPVNSPIITNAKTGEYIQVNQNLASTSDSLVLVYDKDTLSITLNGNSALSSVASGSTYFKIQPGGNNITLSGSSIGSAAYLTINYLDGYALS